MSGYIDQAALEKRLTRKLLSELTTEAGVAITATSAAAVGDELLAVAPLARAVPGGEVFRFDGAASATVVEAAAAGDSELVVAPLAAGISAGDMANFEWPDSVRVQQAIDYASGIFDAYTSAYKRPVVVTEMVKILNLDLAIYDFYKDRAEFDEGVWKVRKAAHDTALNILKEVGAGKAKLDIPLLDPPVSDETVSDGWTGVVNRIPGW